MPFGMYVFCCNDCQRCYHRERGTAPDLFRGDMASWRELLRSQKSSLDEHEHRVKVEHKHGKQ